MTQPLCCHSRLCWCMPEDIFPRTLLSRQSPVTRCIPAHPSTLHYVCDGCAILGFGCQWLIVATQSLLVQIEDGLWFQWFQSVRHLPCTSMHCFAIGGFLVLCTSIRMVCLCKGFDYFQNSDFGFLFGFHLLWYPFKVSLGLNDHWLYL